MLAHTAAIDAARLSAGKIEHFPACFIAAGARISKQGTGRTVCSAGGQAENLPLRLTAEAFQYQTV